MYFSVNFVREDRTAELLLLGRNLWVAVPRLSLPHQAGTTSFLELCSSRPTFGCGPFREDAASLRTEQGRYERSVLAMLPVARSY